MPVTQGDLGLLQHPAAQELLASKIPARLAYIATDGTPRVIPIWFHWTGSEFVLGTPPKAPKLKALAKNPKVSLTIDDNTFPHKVLLVRATAHMETVRGVVPEYAVAGRALLRTRTGVGRLSRSQNWRPARVKRDPISIRQAFNFALPIFKKRFGLFTAVLLTILGAWVVLEIVVIAGQRFGILLWAVMHLAFLIFVAGVAG